MNAIQASQPKDVIIVRTDVSQQQIFIVISDQGGGIDNDIKQKIFDPFFTTKAVGEGSGVDAIMQLPV